VLGALAFARLLFIGFSSCSVTLVFSMARNS
jgi:hypothetical protein